MTCQTCLRSLHSCSSGEQTETIVFTLTEWRMLTLKLSMDNGAVAWPTMLIANIRKFRVDLGMPTCIAKGHSLCVKMNEGHLKSQRITQKLECNTVMNTRHYKRNLWTQYPPKTSKNIYASCFELLINATPEQSWSAFLHSKSKQ